MLISLHKQATTTPKVRAAIRASDEPAWVLAERHGISEQTVWKWRKRDDVQDRSHTPHRLQTTLTPAQEAVVVELRKMLLLPLDDLRVPLDADLARQLQRGDRVLRLRDQPHRLKPLDQRQQRVLEYRASNDRRLLAAAMAEICMVRPRSVPYCWC